MNAAGPAEILLPDPPVTTKRRKLSPFVRKLIVAAMLSFGISILSLSLRSTGNAAHKDFIAYWAAGHLLVEHRNPYDTTAVLRLERSAGFVLAEPIFMRNPLGARRLCRERKFWPELFAGLTRKEGDDPHDIEE
jgi:hypothetical protein